MIYVIEQDSPVRRGMGMVKIGYSERDPSRRLYDLQVGNPYDLEIIAILKGGREREASLHEKFIRWHVRGEWFLLHDRHIDWLKKASLDDYPSTKALVTEVTDSPAIAGASSGG